MEANAKAPIEDPGLYILDLLLRLIGVGLEFEQLRHRRSYLPWASRRWSATPGRPDLRPAA